jgi:D-mannonate dehydratase
MITILFGFGNEKILVKIEGTQVTFANTIFGAQQTTIDGLQLSYEGVIKEFPDLKEDKEWKKKAIERFKEKISNFNTEQERANYIIEDLRKYGYVPERKQINGFRPQKII